MSTYQGRFGVLASIHRWNVRRTMAPRRSVRAEMVRCDVSLFPEANLLPVESNVRFCLGSETVDARAPPALEVSLVLLAKAFFALERCLVRLSKRTRAEVSLCAKAEPATAMLQPC